MLKIGFIAILFLSGSVHAAKPIPPAPKSYVYDETALLSASQSELFQLLSAEDQKFGNQILIAIFKSLDQEDVVDYTNQLFKSWKPGTEKKDNGILLAIFLQERKIRIEVGYGLEPLMTDAKSKRVIEEIIKPAFKAQKFDAGILTAVKQIQAVIHSDAQAEVLPPRDNRKLGHIPRLVLYILIAVLFSVIYFIDRFMPNTFISSSGHRRSGYGGGGYWGGGGFGGGSSGGGGFSGGGGMSGGGGASGDW